MVDFSRENKERLFAHTVRPYRINRATSAITAFVLSFGSMIGLGVAVAILWWVMQ